MPFGDRGTGVRQMQVCCVVPIALLLLLGSIGAAAAQAGAERGESIFKKCKVCHDSSSMAELAACPPSELRRIAQDVGVNDGDLKSLTRSHPGPSELMQRPPPTRTRPGICQIRANADLPRYGESVR